MTDFTIKQGSTFSRVLRWESPTLVYKDISAIAKSAPVSITATSHGVPSGWRVAFQSIKGMTQLNALNTPLKDKDFVTATAVDANTLTINSINAKDFGTYTSGGVVVYRQPVDLTGYSARMQIKNKLTDTTNILSLTSDLNGGIVIDNATKTISVTMTAVQTTALTFKNAVYSLEMVSPGGVVTEILNGKLTLDKEVTR